MIRRHMMVSPRVCRDPRDEKAVERLQGPVAVIEQKLRWIVARWRDHLDEVPDVLYTWIERQKDPLVTVERVQLVVFGWLLDPQIDGDVRSCMEVIQGRLPHWKGGFEGDEN